MKISEKISERIKFKDDFEKIDFLNDTIQLEILHQFIENTGYKKSDIAKRLKVSNSFVSQLFSGDKKLSFYHLACLIYYFNLDCKFHLKPKSKCIIKHLKEYQHGERDDLYFAISRSNKYKTDQLSDDPEKLKAI